MGVHDNNEGQDIDKPRKHLQNTVDNTTAEEKGYANQISNSEIGCVFFCFFFLSFFFINSI